MSTHKNYKSDKNFGKKKKLVDVLTFFFPDLVRYLTNIKVQSIFKNIFYPVCICKTIFHITHLLKSVTCFQIFVNIFILRSG